MDEKYINFVAQIKIEKFDRILGNKYDIHIFWKNCIKSGHDLLTYSISMFVCLFRVERSFNILCINVHQFIIESRRDFLTYSISIFVGLLFEGRRDLFTYFLSIFFYLLRVNYCFNIFFVSIFVRKFVCHWSFLCSFIVGSTRSFNIFCINGINNENYYFL